MAITPPVTESGYTIFNRDPSNDINVPHYCASFSTSIDNFYVQKQGNTYQAFYTIPPTPSN